MVGVFLGFSVVSLFEPQERGVSIVRGSTCTNQSNKRCRAAHKHVTSTSTTTFTVRVGFDERNVWGYDVLTVLLPLAFCWGGVRRHDEKKNRVIVLYRTDAFVHELRPIIVGQNKKEVELKFQLDEIPRPGDSKTYLGANNENRPQIRKRSRAAETISVLLVVESLRRIIERAVSPE